MPATYSGSYATRFRRERIDVDHIIKGFKDIDSEERRELRLDISISCSEETCDNGNCKIDKLLEDCGYCFGSLKDKMIRTDCRRYKYNTMHIPGEMYLDENDNVHIEEGETRISMYKESEHCRLRVHTQAVPGNGGLSSVDLRRLENLKYS